ncbi:hypothetical protein [Rickettsia endosymbiont of Oedothorax gibbosus]|uniref:hypothetical protein n=1 Tax=Rickettsia endosymbiont of Oedothorax gibbosus TaxID=931099 RepID=UPI0020250B4E|nr:hypothetical protein [Rickettsia endosymbiont of Oedothorax gibbosus]
MAKSKDLNTAFQHQHWGEYYYDLAAGLEDDKVPQEKIDASWGLASKAFWFALTLGGKQAPLWLFKCFRQGVGVKEDPYIRDLMYGAALQLTPKDAKTKVKPENKPKILKSMQPAIDALVKLVKDTQKQLPKEGVDAAVFNDQLTKFNHAIKLPGDKLIQSCFTEKSTAATTHDEYGASTSALNASYETCPDTSLESFEDQGDVAMGGVTHLHVCCSVM